MPDFRAYFLGIDGHILRRVDLLVADEDTARKKAKQLADGHVVELWDGARKIATFEPPDFDPRRRP